MSHESTRRPLITAGIMLGIGLGGFVDGIVFHQILQLHNMLSAKYPVQGVDARTLAVHLEVNMFWDGLFHAFCWLVTVLGLGMLWRAVVRPDVALSGRSLAGALLVGWGVFNLVEGLIDHHVLHVHHVTEMANHLTWDLAFLGASVFVLVLGAAMIRTERGERSVSRLSRTPDRKEAYS